MFVALLSYMACCGVLKDAFAKDGRKIASTKYVDDKIREAAGVGPNEPVEIPTGNIFKDPDGLIFSGSFTPDGTTEKIVFEDKEFNSKESVTIADGYVFKMGEDGKIQACEAVGDNPKCCDITFGNAYRKSTYATKLYVDNMDSSIVNDLYDLVVME